MADTPRPHTRAALRTVLVGSVLVLAATALGHLRDDLPWPASLAVHQLRLQSENVLGVWFAAMLFLGAATCFGVAARRAARSGAGSGRVLGWWTLAAVLALISLDELGSYHERLGQVQGINPFPAAGWVGLFAIPGAILVASMVWFGWTVAREEGRVFLLIVVGAALLATVPVQEWIEVNVEWDLPLRAVIEEGTELLAAACFLIAGFARLHPPAPSGAPSGPATWRGTAALLVLGAGAGALAAYGSTFLLPDRPGLGRPSHWFIAAPAFIAGVLALFGVGGARWRGLGAASLVMSADVGASAAISHWILYGFSYARAVIDLALAVGCAAVALSAVRRGVFTRARAGIWLGAALAWVVLPPPGKWVAILVAAAVVLDTLAGEPEDGSASLESGAAGTRR